MNKITLFYVLSFMIVSTSLMSQDSLDELKGRFSLRINVLNYNPAERSLLVSEREYIRYRRGYTGSIAVNYLLNKRKYRFNHYVGAGIAFVPFTNFRIAYIHSLGDTVWFNERDISFPLPYVSLTEKVLLRKKWRLIMGGRLVFLPHGEYSHGVGSIAEPGPVDRDILNLFSLSRYGFVYPEFNLAFGKLYEFKRVGLEFSLGYNYSVFPHLEGSISYYDINNDRYTSSYKIKNSGFNFRIEVYFNRRAKS